MSEESELSEVVERVIELHASLKDISPVRFDPVAIADDDADPDLFPETLQERYPIARKRGEDPTYRRLDELEEADVSYNTGRMRKAASALDRHADRLEAWWDGRPKAAA